MNRRAALLVTLILLLPACTRTPDTSGKKFINIDGIQVHFTQSGMGDKALLMIHGYGSGAFTWKGIQDRTPAGYTTYAIDLPGFGYSDRPEGLEYGLPSCARIVSHFLKAMGRRPAVVVGNSMGGAVSVWTAAEYPDQVAAIVPIDSAGVRHTEQSLPAIFRIIRHPTFGPLLLRLPGRPLMRNTLEQVYVQDERITEALIEEYYLPSRFPGAARAWHRTLADLMRRTDRGEVVTQMGRVKQPVLLLWGAHDTWSPPSRMETFKSHMPQAQSKVYPDLGHVPQEEDPAQVAPDLFAFADEVFAGLR